MLKVVKIFLITLVIGGLWSPIPLSAHQQKTGQTTIRLNPRSGHLEIMHRFYVHDAEHAAGLIQGPHADIIASRKTQEIFSGYIEKHFNIKTGAGRTLTPTSVGYELDGKFFWVYQEIPEKLNPKSLSVTHTVLMDIWADQQNLVNIEGFGPIKSHTFKKNDGAIAFDLRH